MKNYMRKIAGAMAAIMVFSSSIVALAETQQGSTTGQGDLDIVEQSDIFDVVMPVVSEDKSVFDYIIDPTGVIDKSNGEKYGPDANFEQNQRLFFYVSGGTPNYAHESETLTVENKGSVDVDVTVTAKVNAVEGITMVNSAADVSSGDAKLYLGLVDETNSTTVGITTTTVSANGTVSGADATDFDIKYVTDGNGGGHYEKSLKSSASGFQKYEFHLEGDCSVDGWGDLANVTLPAVTVVWTVTGEGTAASTGNGPKVTITSSGFISITGLTKARDYKSISIGGATQIDNCTWDVSGWGGEGGNGGKITIQLAEKWMNWLAGKDVEVIVTLTDGSTIKATTKFN